MIFKQQNGSALVLALLIVSLCVALTTHMSSNFLINIKHQSNYLNEEQAYFYLLAAESQAQRIIFDDILKDKEKLEKGTPPPFRDTRCESWYNKSKSYKANNGTLNVRLEDINSKFNLNNMVRSQHLPRSGSNFPYTSEQQVFVRLLQTFTQPTLNLEEALEIAETVYDWLDLNSEVEGFGGMEDNDYTNENLSYRTANGNIASISELRLIPKITPELYKQLKKHTTVWPAVTRLGNRQSVGALNINTISLNLMRSLVKAQGLLPADPEIVYEAYAQQTRRWGARTGDRTDSRCGFSSKSHFNSFISGGADNPYIGLQSHQILVDSTISLGNARRRMQSVLHRLPGRGKIIVWSRSFGEL